MSSRSRDSSNSPISICNSLVVQNVTVRINCTNKDPPEQDFKQQARSYHTVRTLLLIRALSFRDSMHSLDQTSNFRRKNSSFLPVTSVTTLSVIRQRGRHCCRVVLRVLHASAVQWVLSKGSAFGEEFGYCRRCCWKQLGEIIMPSVSSLITYRRRIWVNANGIDLLS